MEKTNNKKRYGVLAVVLVALLAAGVGTWAWLSATDSKTNKFTVGNIDKPEVKPDPDHPDKPGPDSTDSTVDGYLFETEWNPLEEHKMIPGSSMKKNPNVGIGKDSDSSYVFIYVKNAIVKDGEGALAKTPYFTLNSKWSPVADDAVGAKTNGNNDQYVSGLFMYTAGVPGVSAVLSPTDGKAAYTGELFSTVHIPADMNSTDVVTKPAMTVSCYIFGADQKGDKEDAAANALAQAKEWAADQATK